MNAPLKDTPQRGNLSKKAFARVIHDAGMNGIEEAAFTVTPPESIDQRKAQEFYSKACFYGLLSALKSEGLLVGSFRGQFTVLEPGDTATPEQAAILQASIEFREKKAKSFLASAVELQMLYEQLMLDGMEVEEDGSTQGNHATGS